MTQTNSPSPLATATQNDEGPGTVEEHKCFPNPNPIALYFKLRGTADEIELRIYSKAMVVVEVFRKGHSVSGWQRFDFAGSQLAQSANGLYYYRIVSRKAGREESRSKAGFLLYMR